MAPPPRTPLMQLFSVLAESLLMGVYSILVILMAWIFATRHRSMPLMHKFLFGGCFTMFFIAAAHLALLMEEASGGVLPTPGVGKALIVLATFQFVIGDLILIWRVWVIWGRNHWIVAVPFILMVLAAAFALSLANHSKIDTFYKTTSTVLIVVNTSLCTMLIVGRIWYMQYRLEKATKRAMTSCSNYTGVVALVIESGMLYATSQLLTLILNQIRSPGLSVMLNLQIPLIGILPTLIAVFVHFEMVPGTTAAKTYANRFACPTTQVALDTIVSTEATTSDRMVFGNDLERSLKTSGNGTWSKPPQW